MLRDFTGEQEKGTKKNGHQNKMLKTWFLGHVFKSVLNSLGNQTGISCQFRSTIQTP